MKEFKSRLVSLNRPDNPVLQAREKRKKKAAMMEKFLRDERRERLTVELWFFLIVFVFLIGSIYFASITSVTQQ